MQNLKIIVPVWLFIMSVCYFGIFVMGKKPQRQPAKIAAEVEYFVKGDTLMPDYACPDTLIVINAKDLNKGIALVEQGIIDASDYEIDSILHSNCKQYNEK